MVGFLRVFGFGVALVAGAVLLVPPSAARECYHFGKGRFVPEGSVATAAVTAPVIGRHVGRLECRGGSWQERGD